MVGHDSHAKEPSGIGVQSAKEGVNHHAVPEGEGRFGHMGQDQLRDLVRKAIGGG